MCLCINFSTCSLMYMQIQITFKILTFFSLFCSIIGGLIVIIGLYLVLWGKERDQEEPTESKKAPFLAYGKEEASQCENDGKGNDTERSPEVQTLDTSHALNTLSTWVVSATTLLSLWEVADYTHDYITKREIDQGSWLKSTVTNINYKHMTAKLSSNFQGRKADCCIYGGKHKQYESRSYVRK